MTKIPSKIQHTCNVHLQWFFSSLYFSSIGICYTIERRKITVFKYIPKKGEGEKKGNGKVLNLNPVPKGKKNKTKENKNKKNKTKQSQKKREKKGEKKKAIL